MESLNAIALTFLRPQLSLIQTMELYHAAGSATAVVDNRACLKDILPTLSDDFCNTLKNMDDALRRAEEELEFCEKHQIQVLTPSDEAYPRRLSNCEDAPLTLYYRGNADLNPKRIICIIGTRKCTVYGKDLIQHFVHDLKEKCPDVLIVSGLAYGVDINAHRSALSEGMNTVGVLAHGLDTIYPSMHRETAKQMLSQGGILTEYPKQTRIDKRNFLQRNRIVAGISDACILPESAEHGGGLVTCRLSMDYGRDVFAFPGAVNAEYSAGCNKLIRNSQAQLITCADDFITDMRWDNDIKLEHARNEGIERSLFPEYEGDELTIVNALKEQGDQHPDQLTVITGLSISNISSTLFILEMKGAVRQLAGGIYHLI